MALWPTEEPTFRLLTDEEIQDLDGEKLEYQLKIDKRNKSNYQMKTGLYPLLGISFDLIVAVLLGLPPYSPPVFFAIVVSELVCIYFSIRAYHKLVREVRPQYAKLLQRYASFHPS